MQGCRVAAPVGTAVLEIDDLAQLGLQRDARDARLVRAWGVG